MRAEHSRGSAPHETRVLFVNTRDDFGADVAVHVLLARHLGAAGVHVTFTANRQAPSAAKVEAELRGAPSVRVVSCRLGRPMSNRRGFGRVLAGLGNLQALWSFCRLAVLVWRERVDVLHATDRPRDAILCTLLGHLTGRPSIIHIHSNYSSSMSRLSRWSFAHCTCVLSVSDFMRRSMVAVGVPPERLATALNAVDADHFDPDRIPRGQARACWNIPEGAPLIALIGRLNPYKGHEDLLDALAVGGEALSHVHLLIVGGETGAARTYAASLRARAGAHGLADRVHFTGFQEDVRPIYADLDALVVPSWDEPFGLTVAEAMAMRVPVVAYRSGGIPEFVRSGVEGILVARRSIPELADALQRLIGDPQSKTRIGAAGRRRVLDQLTPARQASEVAALYRRVTGGKGVARHAAAVSHQPPRPTRAQQ